MDNTIPTHQSAPPDFLGKNAKQKSSTMEPNIPANNLPPWMIEPPPRQSPLGEKTAYTTEWVRDEIPVIP